MDKQTLINEIVAANTAYAQGLPFLTDSEYDILWKQLHEIDPTNPILYHTGENNQLPFDKLMHKTQIYGTNKAFSMDDLKPFFQRFGAYELVLEPKYDGCAAILYLGEDEHTDKLILEGDGTSGRDITHHLQHIHTSFEPKNMESVEIIIPRAAWKDSYGKNPRNSCAGWLASKSISQYHNVLSLVSHNNGELQKSYYYDGNLEFLYELLLSTYKEWNELYPLDGIMIKVRDEKKRIIAGPTQTGTYAWSIAWKPPIQTKETKVTQINWHVSRTGRIIPVVMYEPIELCGTVNQKVTANNAKWLMDKNIKVGSTVVIGKAGEIIPKLIAVVDNDNNDTDGSGFKRQNETAGCNTLFNGVLQQTGIDVPTTTKQTLNSVLSHCPICGESLTISGVDLICNGSSCIAQVMKSLDYFYSSKHFDVKGIGPSMILDLLQNDRMRKLLLQSPWALLDPVSFEILYTISSVWGAKRTDTYLKSLQQINNKKNPIQFIAALGLPKLGLRSTAKLYQYMQGKKGYANISYQARESFITGVVQYQRACKELKYFKFVPAPKPAKVFYCITGTLNETRQDTITYLEKFQWGFNPNVTRDTDYLIVGDNPGKIKINRAREINVKIIDLNELDEIINKELKDE